MNILFIDDEPQRVHYNIPDDIKATTYIAHGSDQVNYYLNHSNIKFDLICCDHDMPLCNGINICNLFLINLSIPVVIHSSNPGGSYNMSQILNSYAVPNSCINILNDDWFDKVLNWYNKVKDLN